MLCGKLGVTSYDVVALRTGIGGGSDDCDDEDWTDTDRDNAGSNNDNPDYRDRRPP